MRDDLKLDAKIAAIAARQRGLILREQLLALGCSSSAISRRVAAGRLHRLHPGVYAVGHPVLAPGAVWLAAVLACGPGAVLSHRSAAAAWGLRPDGRSRVDIIAAGSRGRAQPGICAHRCTIATRDRAVVDGIPVTSVARTLLDLAGEAGLAATETALERAANRRLLDVRALEDVLARAGGHRGRGPLAVAISRLDGDSGRTRSELELRARRLIAEAGLPAPTLNAVVLGHEVDLLWRPQRLVVELDGYEHHGGRRAFERDRRRDAELQAAGFRVQRFTWRQVVEDRRWVVACLRRLLA